MKKLITILICLSLSLIPTFGQFNETSLPTDDLDIADIQARIDKKLPDIPELLKFKRLALFPFGKWPNGISPIGKDSENVFQGYSLKLEPFKIYLLDQACKSIFCHNLRTQKLELKASDFEQKNIQFDDFSITRTGVLAVADNSRQSVLIFRNNSFSGHIGVEGERILFRHINFIESDLLGKNFAVYDSGRHRSYVFNSNGKLVWEASEKTEPCFYGNGLISFDKKERTLKINRISELSKTPQNIFTYHCTPKNIILEAYAAGTFRGQLAVVVYEGTGDEDHIDYARLLLFKENKIKEYKFKPFMDLRLDQVKPYRLMLTRNGLQLITLQLSPAGVEVLGAQIE